MYTCTDEILINEATEAMKKALQKYIDLDEKAIVLFSGGRDSSIVASAFCKAFDETQLYLYFVDNGLLHNLSAPRRQYELIKKLNPNTSIYFIEKKAFDLMNLIAIREIEKDFIEHNFSSLLVCITCKLIFTYSVIQYANKMGIKYILDGSSYRQNHFPEQTPIFIQEQKKIFSQNGLKLFTPLYDFLDDKEKIISTLNAFGIPYKQEATCMFAHSFSEAKESEIRDYINKSVELIKRIIASESEEIL